MPQIRKPRFFQSSLSLPLPLSSLSSSFFAMSFTSHLGVFSLVGAHRSTTGLRTMGPGITYSWSIFPGIKEEWNESSGRRRGGHFGGREGKGREETGAAKKNGERERERERRRRAVGEEGGGEGEEREHPITAANTRATVIARPRPYLLFTWLPALCTRTTIPFQRLEPLETLARTRIAPYVVDLLPAAFYSSFSFFLYAASRFHFSFLVFFTFFFFFLFPFWKRRRGKRKARLVTNKA